MQSGKPRQRQHPTPNENDMTHIRTAAALLLLSLPALSHAEDGRVRAIAIDEEGVSEEEGDRRATDTPAANELDEQPTRAGALDEEIARTLDECGVTEEELGFDIDEVDADGDGTITEREAEPYRTATHVRQGDLCVLSGVMR